MHKFSKWFATVCLLIASVATANAQSIAPTKGVVRVKLQTEVAAKVGKMQRKAANGKIVTGVSQLDVATREIKAVSIRPMLPPNPKFAAKRAQYGLDRWYVVDFDENVPVDQARKILAATPGVEVSEAIVPMQLKEGNGGARRVANVPAQASGVSYMFNDPRLPDQWHYQNFGKIGTSVAGADINLFNAWQTETGKSNVVVAIIDGGIDYQHEDLAANMCVNQAELNGTPGVDDDHNGFVDDIYGYNFCTNSGAVYPHNHGTHVAGTVAAVNNNGIGVAGVAGGDGSEGSGVKMISCQVFDSRSGSGNGDFAAALAYAAERGATIAQCSWGWAEPDYYEQAVLDAIDYFTETARSDNMTGGLCIFAAGNMGATGNFYPACYDKVLAVTAMTNELTPAPYSCNGPWADIIAPGGLLDYGESAGVLSTLPSNGYGFMEGTSMATPHVSGIAALILSKYGSPTFVSSSLRTQLETSVNDFYSFGNNEQYRGLYGAGYIDAAKALQMGNGEAPEAVADYVVAAAQDYISLTWTIPASSDNNVHHHIIYYSESPFTADDNLSALSSSVADTKFLSSGDTCTHELTGLKSMTTYYVAIVAVNRWGNASALSEVKSISTNVGPKMTIDVSSLNMNSTADAPEAKATFNIGNDDDGILKWEAYKRTVSMTTSSVSRPVVGNVQPYSGTIAGEVVKRSPSSTASPEYLADDYPKNINYYSQLWAYIGDEDRSLPNSMAQWFKVDADAYPNGFNLTHINVDGDGSRSLGTKPLVQIYKGDAAISSATCIAEVTPSFFAYNYPIALPEQLYFAPGESFWIVLHFDGNLEVYPLSMGTATSETVAQYSYMSNDKGKTWTQLAQALKGSVYESQANQMAWTITARSNNPDWSEMLELNPVSGTVLKGESQPVEVSADGSKLVNGTYKLKLHLTSNEGNGETEHQLPITYKVAGNNPDIIGPKIVNFGSLLVGESKTIEVEVFNRGYGRFAGSRYSAGLYTNNISSSSPHFSGPSSIQTGFPARATVKFNLTYTPTEAGTHTGTITFTDYLGNKANIVVQGVATEPAKLVITPSEVECDTLIVGEPDVQKSFTISNAGKYPLEFVFPKFSSETIEGQSAKLHQFGYTVSSTLQGYNPFAYDGNPELIGATDIASQFTDNNVVSSAINLGFAFPYYGKTYEKAYITSFGGLMFAPNELTFRTPLSPTSESIRGTGLISAYGQQVWMGPQSRVEYAKVDGKFVVKFINVLATVYGDDTTPISFHISLSSNGDIEIYYDDYVADNVFQQGVGLFCGINDPEVADEVTITSADQGDYWGYDEPTEENQRYHSFATGTAVKFEAPKASFVRSLNIPSAIVNPGESVEVVATVGADASLNAGATFNNLAIVTNDPNPDFSFVRFNAVIDGAELTPVAALEKESIDLGKVFRTSVQKVPVTVKNTGHRALTVNSVAVSDAEKLQFNSTDFSPVDIEPGMSKDFIVTVATNNEGVVEGQVTTSTTGGNLNCSIKAEVIGCPEIAIAPDHITDTVASGTPVSQSVSITNNGNETLRYSIAPDQLVSLTLPEKADAVTSYAYRFSGDDSSVKFKWEDIETNGLGEQRTLSYYMAHDYVAVDLPFEFPFYGQKYNKMYIYNTGFVSFTERHDDAIWPEPPAEFPQGTVYTNIIAPYWGLHSMDQTKTAGTFHYVTDDRAVISFIEYGNSMNIGVDYQLILEKDGSFRFQYKGASNEAIIFAPFGLAGISNVDGSEGIRLPERMLKFDNAVEFTPVVELPLAAGQTDKVTIDVDTKRMAGNYSTDLKITTNVPGSENLTFPVNVEITGTAVPQWPNDTIIEHVIGYQSTDYSDPLVQMGAMYNAPVIVKNAGTAPFTIDYVQMTAPQVYDEWFEEYVDVFVLFANVEQEDWFTGEIVKSWTHYPGQPITVGEEPAEFAVPMNQCNFAYTPGEYDIKLTFMCNQDTDSAFTKDVHVKYIVTPAPSLALDKEQIYVKATKETDKFNEKVKLSNEFGDYKLTYSLTLDPTGVGEQVDNGGIGGADPWSAIQANTVKMKADTSACALNQSAFVQPMANNVYVDVPNDFEYRNALYYPAAPYETMTYNYGSGNTYDVFKEAVAFTAPEEGFNLSHIYFAVSAGGVNDYPVDFDIVTGSTPGQGDVIGHGQYIDTGGSTTGKLVVVPLSKPVYLNPGEEFHVQVTYGVGNKYPAYVCPKEEAVVPGRYMGWVESAGWFDVAELFREQYGSLGFVLTCLETTEGEPWVKLLTPASNAVVEAGDTTNIEVAINAASARLEKNNKAMLVIKSNDPNQPVINFPIILDKNGTPVIATPEGIVYAKEGEDTNVAITINDPDNDDLTIAFNDPNGNAVVSSIDAGTATVAGENGVYTITGVDGVVAVNVVISPKYGSASEGNVFNITATDANGLSAEASVRYDIEHVNRAPVAIEPSPAEVNIEDLSCVYRFADYFTDPDGDEMTYSFNLAANDIVDAYPNATGVVFFGKKVGTVTATLTATDAQGATASVAWPIVVIDASGIADITNDDSFRVTPNPVDGDINVYTDFNASNVSFSLYDAAGHIVFNITADCAPGSATVLPGDSLANGIYILTATTSDGIIRATRIVKK